MFLDTHFMTQSTKKLMIRETKHINDPKCGYTQCELGTVHLTVRFFISVSSTLNEFLLAAIIY